MTQYTIAASRLEAADERALIALHLEEMHAASPACHVHAMPVDALAAADVAFFAARCGGQLAAIGALRQVEPGHGELKSMRAHPDFRGKGAGRAILEHLLAEARARGHGRVSLETGGTAPFADALRLYARYGFVRCPPFAGYADNEFSQCWTLALVAV